MAGKKKILLMSDDLRMHSGIATQSKEFVMGTLHHYDWVQIAGAVKHPEDGKIIDMSEAVRNELKIKNANISILEKNQSEIFWNKIKTLEFFHLSKNNIFRIVIPPSECIKLIYQFSNNFKYYLDWGGALIWVEAFEMSELMFESIKRRVVKLGGYMTMIKNSDYLTYVEDVFTINKDRFNMSHNIKKSFDPNKILNTGKMYSGI